MDYVDGYRHGKELWYFESGQLKRDTNYVYYERHGKDLKYAKNGEIESIKYYISKK